MSLPPPNIPEPNEPPLPGPESNPWENDPVGPDGGDEFDPGEPEPMPDPGPNPDGSEFA